MIGLFQNAEYHISIFYPIYCERKKKFSTYGRYLAAHVKGIEGKKKKKRRSLFAMLCRLRKQLPLINARYQIVLACTTVCLYICRRQRIPLRFVSGIVLQLQRFHVARHGESESTNSGFFLDLLCVPLKCYIFPGKKSLNFSHCSSSTRSYVSRNHL